MDMNTTYVLEKRRDLQALIVSFTEGARLLFPELPGFDIEGYMMAPRHFRIVAHAMQMR